MGRIGHAYGSEWHLLRYLGRYRKLLDRTIQETSWRVGAREGCRVEFEKYDHYGRILGKVWVSPPDCPTCDKTLDVGLAQITSGMAWWFRRYAHEQSPEDQGRYEFAEQEAKAMKVGPWKEENPMPPWEFRRK